MANSVYPDHMLYFAASDLGLHYLQRPIFSDSRYALDAYNFPTRFTNYGHTERNSNVWMFNSWNDKKIPNGYVATTGGVQKIELNAQT